MMFRRFIKKTAAAATAALMAISVPAAHFIAFTASAESGTFAPLEVQENEKGIYKYHFEGKLTNPCNSEAVREKSNVIGDFWFEFTYIDENGTGQKHTEKLDMSYSGKGNKNSDFLNKNFVRNNDNETGLDFDLYIPGQLTNMRIHLELNGRISFFSYERMSFEIKNVTANGVKVNTSSDYVSSTVGSSDASINFIMDKPDSVQIASAFGQREVTLNEFKDMIDTGRINEKPLTDKYGAVFTDNALRKIAETSDSEINQGFSHRDEPGMYIYTLKMLIENPVNVSSSGQEKIDNFIIDFTLADSKHYKLDMSWDAEKDRNRNSTFANLFCRSNDDETTAEMNVWVPGMVSRINVTLKMSGGERLTVTFADVLLGGLKVNTKSDYVTSAIATSNAEISCTVPDSLIDFYGIYNDDLEKLLNGIYEYDGTVLPVVRDQFGSIANADRIKAAHDDMMICINAEVNDTRPVYDEVIPGFYMYKTVYRAESNSELQEYIAEKKAAAGSENSETE